MAWWAIAGIHEDLKDRLQMIPDGMNRSETMIESLEALMLDMTGTVPEKQRKTIVNIEKDMDLRLVPKFTPMTNRCVMDVRDLAYIVRAAKKDICLGCVMDGIECKECELYQILASITPPEDWGEDTRCPFDREDWYER